MDIGDQIPLSIGVAGLRFVGHVGGQALRSRQSGTFSNEQHDQFGLQQVTDFVQDSDSAVADDEGLANRPAEGYGPRFEKRQDGRDLSGDCRRRQTISDDNLKVASGRASGSKSGSGRLAQATTEVWSEQVLALISGLRLDFEKSALLD